MQNVKLRIYLDLYNTETADDAQRVKTEFDIMRTKYLKKRKFL